MTHAWQFAAHPWLRPYMENSMGLLVDSVTKRGAPISRIAAFAGVLPSQWKVMRQVQGTMSVIEGFSNLVMNQLGVQLLPGFERLEQAYRERSSGKSPLEVLIWKLTGLDLKLQQYRRGEAFCRAIYEQHGIEVLNDVWHSEAHMPHLEELAHPEAWYRRVVQA
jgi:putative hydrolase